MTLVIHYAHSQQPWPTAACGARMKAGQGLYTRDLKDVNCEACLVSDEAVAQSMENALEQRPTGGDLYPKPGTGTWEAHSRKHKFKNSYGKSYVPPHQKRR